MSEPGEIQFDCIGCGAMNPAGAEVCAGCGHRFAGPDAGPIARALPPMAPEPEPDFDPYRIGYESRSRGPRSTSSTALGCLATGFGVVLAIVASVAAFGVAFFVTCTSLFGNGNGDSVLLWSSIVGCVAVGLVVWLSVWIASLIRADGRSRR